MGGGPIGGGFVMAGVREGSYRKEVGVYERTASTRPLWSPLRRAAGSGTRPRGEDPSVGPRDEDPSDARGRGGTDHRVGPEPDSPGEQRRPRLSARVTGERRA